jgi:hypothetical protein
VLGKNIQDDTKVRRERRINNIKSTINRVTSQLTKKGRSFDGPNTLLTGNQNPVALQIKHDEYYRFEKENGERIENIKAKILAQNYERLNIYDIMQNSQYSLIEKLCKELPEDIKGTFLMEYFKVQERNYLDEEEMSRLEKAILEVVPRDLLKFDIIQNSNRYDEVYMNLFKKLEIDFLDIQNYYRKTGYFPNLSLIDSDIKIKTAEELISELKYFKDEGKEKFFFEVIWKLPENELQKILEAEDIDDRLKVEAYRKMTFGKNDTEKLEIYQKILSM